MNVIKEWFTTILLLSAIMILVGFYVIGVLSAGLHPRQEEDTFNLNGVCERGGRSAPVENGCTITTISPESL